MSEPSHQRISSTSSLGLNGVEDEERTTLMARHDERQWKRYIRVESLEIPLVARPELQ
ncbi:hypothetical protein CLV67_123131 [Actinoplanes italicus]|uniref:Uncharacterized protein n=1 Tax=Actinoplanes italicus TaxID=113567 RepID=A0A2T0JYX6_9ACTN|nr:hypothetical protein CLV67_123131 [Actinoplanes italicus]